MLLIHNLSELQQIKLIKWSYGFKIYEYLRHEEI